MADNFLNYTGLGYFKDKLDNEFATAAALQALSDEVDDIIAEGGEPNVIETVKVNGTELTPVNKAVDVTVPTAVTDLSDASDYALAADIPADLSDLTNTGQDPYATESYVDQNGGKIDVIKVNGTAQTITNKAVDIIVPTAVSDLTDDVGIQDASDVAGAISDALANSGDAYQTESDVDGKIATALTSAMEYKGSVATYADLPSSGNKVGDFYNVLSDGKNYAWDGSAWDDAGGTIDMSAFWTSTSGQNNTLVAITTSQIDSLFA